MPHQSLAWETARRQRLGKRRKGEAPECLRVVIERERRGHTACNMHDLTNKNWVVARGLGALVEYIHVRKYVP